MDGQQCFAGLLNFGMDFETNDVIQIRGFLVEESDLFLFVADGPDILETPAGTPRLAKVSLATMASCYQAGKTFLVEAGDEDLIREYLSCRTYTRPAFNDSRRSSGTVPNNNQPSRP